MYAGERATLAFSDGEISPTFPSDAQGRPELTRGVEVIEMANGETIWYADMKSFSQSFSNSDSYTGQS
jgi:hypothetical protein